MEHVLILIGTFIDMLIRKKKKKKKKKYLVKRRSKRSYEMVRVGIAGIKV